MRLVCARASDCYTRTFSVVTHTVPHPQCYSGARLHAAARSMREVIDLLKEIRLTVSFLS